MAEIVACASCGKKNRVPVAALGTPRCASCHVDLPWIVDAGEDDFSTATSSRVPVLVDLWAPRDGELVARQVGALPADQLVAWVRAVVEPPERTGGARSHRHICAESL